MAPTLIEWLPHEELVNGEWVEVSGAARDDQADYFRSQLSLFARLSFGRNKLASSTIVELVPLEALLLLLLPETMARQSGRRLLARDRQLCCELLLWVFLDSCELDIVKQSLIEKLYLWEPPSPPSTDDERKKHIDNSICGPPTQLTNLEADESSAWTREEVGIPVWRVEGETRETSPGISSPARMVTTNSWVGPSLVPDVIALDDAHVADQQRRLLRFVSQALDDPKVLVFRGFAPAAEATEEERHLMEADKHRFRFYLSVLKMLKLMVADGMYAPDYILPPKPRAEGRPSEAKSKSGRDFRGVSERSTPRGGGGGGGGPRCRWRAVRPSPPRRWRR